MKNLCDTCRKKICGTGKEDCRLMWEALNAGAMVAVESCESYDSMAAIETEDDGAKCAEKPAQAAVEKIVREWCEQNGKKVVDKPKQKELTTVVTVELTFVERNEDVVLIGNNAEGRALVARAIESIMRKSWTADDVKVVKIQEFLREE